jgi:hypothetical protein
MCDGGGWLLFMRTAMLLLYKLSSLFWNVYRLSAPPSIALVALLIALEIESWSLL